VVDVRHENGGLMVSQEPLEPPHILQGPSAVEVDHRHPLWQEWKQFAADLMHYENDIHPAHSQFSGENQALALDAARR
jgi:hypothetical protein